MTGEEALVECLIKAKDVRDTSWYEGAFIRVSKDDSSKLIDHNGRTVSLCIFSDNGRVWEIHDGVKPKEACTFAELFEKLGPGDWATETGGCGEFYLDDNGHLALRWLGLSDRPVVTKGLVNSTFTIHRAKQ